MANGFQRFIQRVLGSETKQSSAPAIIPFTPRAGFGLGEPPGIGTAAMLQHNRSWVYACVTKKAQEIAMLDLCLFKRSAKGEITEVPTHESLDVIDRANNHMTRYDLFETTGMFLELTGECFWWLMRDKAGKVVGIYPWLSPAQMTVIPSSTDFVGGYMFQTPSGQPVSFTTDEIVHFKYTNPENPYRGLSPLKAAELAVATDTEASKWNWRFFKNEARPGGVITLPGTLNQEQYDRARAQWEAGHKGGENAHRIAIIEGGGKFEEVGFGQKDMDFIEQRRMARDEILAIFKVPKTVLGLTEDINRATAEAQKAVFLEEVVFPLYHKIIGALNEFYLPHFGDDSLFFGFNNQAPREVASLILYYNEGLKDGWLAPNEVRQMEGFDPFEGGDVVNAPFGIQPIGTVPSKAKRANPSFKRYRRSTEQKIRDVIKRELTDKMDKLQKQKVSDGNTKMQIEHDFPHSTLKTYAARDSFWLQKVKKIERDERKWAGELQKLFSSQQRRVIGSISEKAFKTSVRFQFDIDDEMKIFTRTFSPLLKLLIAREGEAALAMLGKQDFRISTDRVQTWIEERGLEFAKGVNETTKDKIKEAIEAGVGEGEGVTAIKDRVRDVFKSAEESRAYTIARTEVNRASSFAQIEGFEQSGVVGKVEWLTAGDERVDSEICEPMDGETVKLGEAWTLPDGTSVEVPQDAHPNCRCTPLPIASRD